MNRILPNSALFSVHLTIPFVFFLLLGGCSTDPKHQGDSESQPVHQASAAQPVQKEQNVESEENAEPAPGVSENQQNRVSSESATALNSPPPPSSEQVSNASTPSLRERFSPLKPGEQLTLTVPSGQTYDIAITSRKSAGQGITVLSADLLQNGLSDEREHMTATLSGSGIFGRLQTRDTVYQITTRAGRTILVDLYGPDVQLIARSETDRAIPPDPPPAFSQSATSQDMATTTGSNATSEPPLASQQSSTTPVIDLMILYTPGMKDLYPNDLLENRLNYLVTLANATYTNSSVDAALRLVHTQQIDYEEQTANATALDDITEGTGSLSGIAELRETHGADLVVMIRPFHYTSQASCGIAWLLNKSEYFATNDYGYAVISDGSDSSLYCSDITMAHEIGHILGSDHDRANATSTGLYPYSYGYGIEGDFGTIMSYLNPEVDIYSTPNQTCGSNASPCGKDIDQPDAAYNALSLNETPGLVADFLASQHNGDINGDGNVDLLDAVLALRIAAGQPLSTAIQLNQDVDRNERIGLAEALHALTKTAEL